MQVEVLHGRTMIYLWNASGGVAWKNHEETTCNVWEDQGSTELWTFQDAVMDVMHAAG
jgi:hypothetical protein